MLDPSNAAEWVITVAAVLTGLGVIAGVVYKYVWKPVRSFNEKINRGMDTLLGYDAVKDPATGREIQKRTPPLANRVFDLEEAIVKIGAAMETFAKTHNLVVELERRWDEREKIGQAIVTEWTAWREAHEKEAVAREERLAEWEQWRSEQTLLGAIVRENLDLPVRGDEQ